MNNPVSTIFKVLAYVVFIGGFIAGIVLGKDTYGDFSFGLAIIYWSAFFVAGMLYYGFAEIIQLLTDIRDKSSSTYSTNSCEKNFGGATINNTNTTRSTETTIEKSIHTWRCSICDNMISENPCPFCNNDTQHKEK